MICPRAEVKTSVAPATRSAPRIAASSIGKNVNTARWKAGRVAKTFSDVRYAPRASVRQYKKCVSAPDAHVFPAYTFVMTICRLVNSNKLLKSASTYMGVRHSGTKTMDLLA